MSSPEIRALLVGIDAYLPIEELGTPAYQPLGGAVNDIRRVEAFLRDRLKVPQDRITCLTASSSEDITQCGPCEPVRSLPTASNLRAACESLVTNARPGEQVLIYYSGHGGRSKTTLKAKRDHGIRHDECLVPVDIGLSREIPYLRDHELADLVRQLAAAETFVTLVLDCCHSGGLTRAARKGETLRERGLRQIDPVRRPPRLLSPPRTRPPKHSGHGWSLSGDRACRLPGLAGTEGYAMLAACRPQESALEVEMEGGVVHGVLTHWLMSCLETVSTGLTIRQLYNRVVGQIHGRFPYQTPQIEGETRRLFLGRDVVHALDAVNVVRGEREMGEDRLELQVGAIQAIGKGASLALYPQQASDLSEASRLAVVEVVEVGAGQSVGEVVRRAEGGRLLEAGDQAVLLEPGPLQLRRAVRIISRGGQLTTAAGKQARRRLEAALEAANSGFLELVEEGDNFEGFEVQISETGEYCLCDGAGFPFAYQGPRLPSGAARAASLLVARLIHMAKYRNVRQVGNRRQGVPINQSIEFTVGLAGERPESVQVEEPNERFEDTHQGFLTVRDSDSIHLHLVNRAGQPLNVALLDLQPDWGISQAFPLASPFHLIEPGQSLTLALDAGLPSTIDKGVDVLKVFAATCPLALHTLWLPPLDQHHDHFRGRRQDHGDGSLNALLEAMAVYDPPSRNMTASPEVGQEWTTAQVEVLVQRQTNSRGLSEKEA